MGFTRYQRGSLIRAVGGVGLDELGHGSRKVIRKISDESVEICVQKTFVQNGRQQAILKVVATGWAWEDADPPRGRREQRRGGSHRSGS